MYGGRSIVEVSLDRVNKGKKMASSICVSTGPFFFRSSSETPEQPLLRGSWVGIRGVISST